MDTVDTELDSAGELLSMSQNWSKKCLGIHKPVSLSFEHLLEEMNNKNSKTKKTILNIRGSQQGLSVLCANICVTFLMSTAKVPTAHVMFVIFYRRHRNVVNHHRKGGVDLGGGGGGGGWLKTLHRLHRQGAIFAQEQKERLGPLWKHCFGSTHKLNSAFYR